MSFITTIEAPFQGANIVMSMVPRGCISFAPGYAETGLSGRRIEDSGSAACVYWSALKYAGYSFASQPKNREILNSLE